MPRQAFSHVTDWVFDLDNTLYPPGSGLFAQIEARMNHFVARELRLPEAEASALRHGYWRKYGTTLAGLMAEHGVAPDPYLAEVHAIDLSDVAADPALRRAIKALPGRKIIFTNGSRRHGETVSAARGLAGCFDAIYGIEDAGYVPKPNEAAFARVFAASGTVPARAAMFDDDPVNLSVPARLGMRTVLVGPGETAPHVSHLTTDLAGFLTQLA